MNRSHSSMPGASRLFAPTLIAAALALGALPTDAQAGCSIKCAFRTFSKEVKGAGDKGIKFASDQGRALASVSAEEFRVVKSGANQVVAETRNGLETGYNQALSTVGGFMDDVLIKALRAQANSFIRQSQGSVTTVATRADKLSDQARAALKRLIKAMPGKQVTSAMKADMQLIAKEMGFNELFGSVKKSSWGIGIGADIGAGPAGANTSIALVMDVQPNGKGGMNGAIVSSVGGATGIDAGVGASVTLFWQPGVASESTGLSLGWGASLGTTAGGGGAEISFGIPIDPKDYSSVMNFVKAGVSNLVPSIGVSVDIPGTVVTEFEVSYDINVGYSQVVTTFEVNPSEICQFVTGAVNGITSTKLASGSSCPGASSDSR